MTEHALIRIVMRDGTELRRRVDCWIVDERGCLLLRREGESPFMVFAAGAWAHVEFIDEDEPWTEACDINDARSEDDEP